MSYQQVDHDQYDLWWKTAVIYCLDVEMYLDTDGDGIGDFRGLIERVDYLAGLGITCIWLMPFYPTPNRDDGYDVTDYVDVDDDLGDLGDLAEFVRAASERGIRVIADLVVNHTSDQHPWFQQARTGPDSPYHDYYVWSDERPEDWETALVFPGDQVENWTYDRKAGRYYLHRFYRHQPDLNPTNPAVQEEIKRVLGLWTQLGLSGFRVDAVPFLIELSGIEAQTEMTPHGFLREMAAYLGRRRGDAILLGEVNLPPQDALKFFGEGDELQMLFNFHVNQFLHLSLVRNDADPVRKALERLPAIPSTCQWANFLTNHDELTLDQLTESERQEVFDEFGPQDDMQLFGRGIRRRLPSMLGGDLARLHLAYTVLFSLPGTPVLFYGEEIGMGENLDIPGRRAVRSPMQWTSGRNAGFSTAPTEEVRRPVTEGPFGPANVNALDQARDPESILGWMKRLIRMRRETPEFGMGSHTLLDLGHSEVLAHRSDWGDRRVIALHNFSDEPVEVDVKSECGDRPVVDVWSDRNYGEVDVDAIRLSGHGYRWLRLTGSTDKWFL